MSNESELRAEIEILRGQVDYGIAKALRQHNTLAEQAAVHKIREKLLENAAHHSAQHIRNITVLGLKLDGVRQELTARAEAAESALQLVTSERDRLLGEVEVLRAGAVAVRRGDTNG